MNESLYHQMRLIVMYDLPVETDKQKKIYVKLRKFLLQDGFTMLQYSVYVRYCHNTNDCEKHINRVIKQGVEEGNIRILKITESQFQNLILVSGNRALNEDLDFFDKTIVIE